jgi:hypothetical protein
MEESVEPASIGPPPGVSQRTMPAVNPTELVGFWIICAIACTLVAASRDRSIIGWLLLGLLFGALALVLVIALPSNRPGFGWSPRGRIVVTRMKRCRECAETVPRVAHVCSRCGHRFGWLSRFT